MEELLQVLVKDAHAAKFQPIRSAAQLALDTLSTQSEAEKLAAFELREKCLLPLHLALESKTKRLMTHALSGIEKMLKDERFQSSLESASEDQWLPLQILSTVYSTPNLPEEIQADIMKVSTPNLSEEIQADIMKVSTPYLSEEIQADVMKVSTPNLSEQIQADVMKVSTPNLPEEIQADIMKLLLKMALSTAWCMNTKIVTRISQVFIDTYTCSGSSCNLRGLVQAALAQLLGSYSERLSSALKHGVSTAADVMSDFYPKEDHVAERLMSDVVSLLYFLSEKITMAMKAGQCKQAVPLLLEGVLAILTNSPEKLQTFTEFQQLVWQSLCPTLISLLGMPKSDKGKPAGDPSKNMDSTLLSPTTAKIIYSISVQICKMLGPVQSLRPVLESLFHRMLICSSPLQRHDAVKAIRELLSDPRKLCDISVAYVEDERNGSKPAKKTNDLALIKLFMESIRECCHTSDSSLCFTCVLCVSDLLTSIQQLDNGCGLHDDSVKVIERKYLRTQDKRLSLSERAISVTSQSDIEDPPLNTNNSNVYNNSDANNLNKTANTSNSLENGEFLKSTKNDCKLGTIETKNSNHTENTSEDGKEKSDDVIDNHKTEEKVSEQTAKVRENTGSKVKERSNPRESLSDGMKLGENEKKSARCFIDELARTIPHLLSLYTVTDVDEALQEFASDFAENNMGQLESQVGTDGHLTTMLNADSIYSTSYAVLCLSLHLHMNNFHTLGHRSLIPVTEGAFQDSVLDTDMFLYLSPDWLSYVYQAILAEDILEPFTGILEDDSPLVWALTDIDGDSSLGGQMMRNSVSRMQEEIVVTGHNVQHAQAGKLIANQILQACWDSILDILTTVLSGKSVIGATNMLAIMIGTDGAKEETLRRRDALCKCLDGLQIAAKLCCSLGLQERCESVFTLLANTSCVMEDLIHASQVSPGERAGQKGGTLMPQAKPKLVTLHASHVLSMDAIMTTGLEIGSHSIACWKQVFRCCAFISELERTYFSGGNNQSSLPRIQQEQSTPMVAALEEGEDDIYTIPLTPIVPVAPKINVATLIAQSSIESGWDRAKSGAGELNSVQASQALCGLSQQVDRVFEDAANNLNMRALSGFLSSLCEASKQQLQKLSRKLAELEEHPTDTPITPLNSLHLYRLQSVLIKVAHSNRPLIHIIKAWSVVSAYLVESAGHRDRSVSKMAVACVHDFIITVMSTHSELGHFHTNEMLCKTFENILCLELCDGDVQDQIVCSICELVEASASDVKSGWRPLFGALRAVRIEYTTVEEVNEARQRHIEAVLDVFDVYLNTDNIVVFASATVDCILCLLKYVRGPGEFSDSDTDDSDSELEYQVVSTSCGNLCLPALQYLRQCSLILQSMLNMPACPVFHGAKRIQVDALSRCIDTVILNINFKTFSEHFTPYHENEAIAESSEMLPPISGTENVDELPSGDSASLLSNDSGILISKSDSESSKMATESSKMATKSKMAARLVPERIVGLDDLDKPSGILHVWFLLLEGMSGAVSSCPREFQPKTMEMLFELLRAASHVPGPEFAMFCSKHLLFPMIQSWLRSGARKFGYWEIGATNFKQCCGHTTDLIVDLIHEFKDHADLSGQLEERPEPAVDRAERVCGQSHRGHIQAGLFMYKVRWCVASPTEVISRLGCSCIR
ncbi:hypothetical protein DPMN_042687 [Dreissena polymorpha]|uniref:SEC7 domain-containing protein n=1 Tax=Dreissena polymorpha TaxID=45954 RepID=A0A9D4D000_DREPO|nr:hypothetical protein DPMN_042687 [Dreissena polymorpha]